MERKVLKPLRHTHGNQGESVALSMSHTSDPGDKLSSSNGVMTEDRRQAWPEETDCKKANIVSDDEKNQALRAIHS
jgi:hypothetical protein